MRNKNALQPQAPGHSRVTAWAGLVAWVLSKIGIWRV